MPIYDNDGSANREISLIYDNDGSANRQIAYVYDNNGTTNSLIYKATPDPITLVPNASLKGGWAFRINNYDDGNGANASYSWDGDYLELRYGSMGASVQARYYLDLTGFSTISFHALGTLDYARVMMGIKDDWAAKWSDKNWLALKEIVYASGTGYHYDQTYTLDISSINKGSYVVVYAYGGSTSSRTVEWKNITLRP